MFKEVGYSFIINEDNLIVRDHIVHGAKVMPGIVFLDMCIKVLISEKIDYKTIEFRNILFKTPIELVSCQKRELIISLENLEQKSYIIGKSRAIDKTHSNNTEEFVYHFECEIYNVSLIEAKELSLSEELSKNTATVEDMDNAYKFVRDVGITHKSFMKAEGKVYCFNDKIISHNMLSHEANQHKNSFFHQPSIMDSSTILPYLCIRDKKQSEIENKAFIPIHIEKFRAFKPLGSEAYIYIENKDVFVANSGDITNASWKIYDENGHLAADVVRLSSKQIREVGMATKHVSQIEDQTSNRISEQTVKSPRVTLKSNDIENYIVEKIQELKNVNLLISDLEKGFYEIGLDSKDLISVVKKIENQISIKLYPTIMFEYANVKDLGEYLKSEFNEQFEQYFDKSNNSNNVEQNQPSEQKQIKENVVNNTSHSNYNEKVIFETRWIEPIEKKEYSEDYNSELTIIFSNDTEIYGSAKNQYRNVKHISINKMHKVINDDNSYYINPLSNEEIERLFSNLVPGHANINVVNMLDFDCFNEFTCNYPEQIIYNFNLLFCKALIKFSSNKTQIRILNLTFHDDSCNCYTNALAGFYKCLSVEKSGITSSIITLEYDKKTYNSKQVWSILHNEFAKQELPVNEVKYVDYKRYIKAVNQVDYKERPFNLFKDEGVYIITGGMGAIIRSLVSRIFKEYNCVLILLGRRKLTDEMQAWLTTVNGGKAKVIYHSVDICNKKAVSEEVQGVINQFKKINGIIHAAGNIQDAMIMSKEVSVDESDTAITSKVIGINNLDMAIGTHEIDFIILFSSISAVFGNLGQSNYAYGNAYLDNFAQMRNKYVEKKLRYGRTLSINWPLWESGGMDVGYDYQHIFDATGIEKMNHEVGINLLMNANYQNSSQAIMLSGVQSKISKFIKDYYKVIEQNNDTNIQNFTKSCLETDDIAIIGIGGQFPMADNVIELWDNLKNGKDCIQTVPVNRWTKEDIKAILGDDSTLEVSNYGGFLNEIDKFDSRLFNITPTEAKMMDPQERLFLSTVWTTLEDAGYSMKQLMNKDIGVFVGVMWGQYQMLRTVLDEQVALPSSIYASVANRISYYFNWHGPSLTIDTMCSSAMTAIKMACESINNDGAVMAIAGGVNLSIHPAKYIVLAQNNFTSKDGRCRTFGENGTGYVPGEGTGALLLKKLDKAIEDGDHIYGVIKACEINHGGKTGGYSVPSVQYQAKVIEKALQSSKLSASELSYIEAHGTGTELGDPIEIRALQTVFNKYTKQRQYCSIGSIKSNIGHLEAASGIAGIIKVLLQMKYKKLVPSLHSKRTNPNINFEETAFYCQQEYADWYSNGLRAAAISSFGAGGSNANIIIQEYEPKLTNVRNNCKRPKLFVFSASNQDILINYIKRHREFLNKLTSCAFQNINNKTSSDTEEQFDLEQFIIDYFKLENNKNLDEILLDEINFDLYKMVNIQKQLEYKRIESPQIEQLVLCKSIGELRQMIKKANENREKSSEIIPVSPISSEEEANFLDSYEYTLQVGRVQMKERLAIVASTIEELIGYLEMFLKNKSNDNIVFKHRNEGDNSFLAMFNGIEGINFIKTLISNGNLNNIATMWVEGIDMEWEKLIDIQGRKRISIPTYPFSNEKIQSAQLVVAHDKQKSQDEEYVEELDLYEIIKKVESGTISVNDALCFLERGI